jgi:hypothetical protein
MFTGKILPKMAPHGLASGEHCEKKLNQKNSSQVQDN